MDKPRARIGDVAVQPVGRFAIFRHKSGAGSAKFACFHDSLESADEESRRLTAEMIARDGVNANETYYIVKIVGRVGIINGRLKAEPS